MWRFCLVLFTIPVQLNAAQVIVSDVSVHREEGLVEVDFLIKHTADPGFAEFISNIAMHVVAQNENGDVLPIVPFGNEFDGGLFDTPSPRITTHENPTEKGILFVADYIGRPWNVKVGAEPLPNTTILRSQLPKHLATVSFLINEDTPLGVYAVTPAWDGQLSAVVTSGPSSPHGTIWYNVPMTYETGTIIVHTPEPSSWILLVIGICLGIWGKFRK